MDPASFVRPMLNSPVRESTVDAEFFVKRAVARLDASRQGNVLTFAHFVYDPHSSLNFRDRSRLIKIWQSLQERYRTR